MHAFTQPEHGTCSRCAAPASTRCLACCASLPCSWSACQPPAARSGRAVTYKGPHCCARAPARGLPIAVSLWPCPSKLPPAAGGGARPCHDGALHSLGGGGDGRRLRPAGGGQRSEVGLHLLGARSGLLGFIRAWQAHAPAGASNCEKWQASQGRGRELGLPWAGRTQSPVSASPPPHPPLPPTTPGCSSGAGPWTKSPAPRARARPRPTAAPAVPAVRCSSTAMPGTAMPGTATRTTPTAAARVAPRTTAMPGIATRNAPTAAVGVTPSRPAMLGTATWNTAMAAALAPTSSPAMPGKVTWNTAKAAALAAGSSPAMQGTATRSTAMPSTSTATRITAMAVARATPRNTATLGTATRSTATPLATLLLAAPAASLTSTRLDHTHQHGRRPVVFATVQALHADHSPWLFLAVANRRMLLWQCRQAARPPLQ